jgi:hypothetical protein
LLSQAVVAVAHFTAEAVEQEVLEQEQVLVLLLEII